MLYIPLVLLGLFAALLVAAAITQSRRKIKKLNAYLDALSN